LRQAFRIRRLVLSAQADISGVQLKHYLQVLILKLQPIEVYLAGPYSMDPPIVDGMSLVIGGLHVQGQVFPNLASALDALPESED